MAIDYIGDLRGDAVVPRYTTDGCRVNVTAVNLRSVIQGSWYDDTLKDTVTDYHYDANIINGYLELIKKRSANLLPQPGLEVIRSDLWSKLTINYSEKHRALIKHTALFMSKMVFFPIKLDEFWTLLVVDNDRKCVTHYDTSNIERPEILIQIKQLMAREAKKRGLSHYNSNHWDFSQPVNIPKNNKDYDSGTYLCMFAEYLSRRAKLPVLINIKNLRAQQTMELIANDMFYK